MKTLLKIILVVIVALMAVFFSWQSTKASVGNLQIYNGAATIIRDGRNNNGTTGAAVHLHDTIKIDPSSRVAVVLKDGSVIRFDAGTEVEIAELDYNGKELKKAVFDLKFGRLWSHVSAQQGQDSFEVETPTTVATVHGTSFNTTYQDHFSGIYVYRHTVHVALKKDLTNEKNVDENQLLRMRDDHLDEDFGVGPGPLPSDFIDEWIKFNQREDDALDHVTSLQSPNGMNSTTPSSSPEVTPSAYNTSQPSTPTSIPSSTLLPSLYRLIQTPTASPTPTLQPTLTPKTLNAIALSASPVLLHLNDTVSFKITAKYSDGSSNNITDPITWNQTPQLGKISGTTFTATSAGTTNISATYQGITSNSVSLEIRKTISALRIFPTNINESGRSAQFMATAIYVDQTTQDVTSKASWSLNLPANGSISKSGFYQAGRTAGDTVVGEYDGTSASVQTSL